MDTYVEHFIRLNKDDIKHTELVILQCLDTLRSVGLQGVEMEVNQEQGILYISIYPDILERQLTTAGKQSGRPRKPILADKESIRDMIDTYGAEETAKKLGISKKTLYRRLAEYN